MRKEPMIMKIFRMFARNVRDAFKSVFRNFSLSLASISCISVTLIIVAVALVASVNVKNFTKELERTVTINVFLEEDVTDEVIKDLDEKIKKLDNLASYYFQTKEEATKEFQSSSEILDGVVNSWKEGDTPLLNNFRIKVKDINYIDDTVKELRTFDGIKAIKYGEEWVGQMATAFGSVEKVTYGIVIALTIVTVFLIMNTIRLTIFSRKREISIMRLVGASNINIKMPFIIEGMVLGALGSIIPIFIITFGYLKFYHHFDGYLYFKVIQLVTPEPFMYYASAIVLVIGMLVGMIGSASAVKKYLKI